MMLEAYKAVLGLVWIFGSDCSCFAEYVLCSRYGNYVVEIVCVRFVISCCVIIKILS